jgi:hypothetical protein
MAKGLIGVGRVQKDQAMRALGESARLEAEQQIAQEAIDANMEVARKQTQGTLAGTGAAIGYFAGAAGTAGAAGGAATGASAGMVGGPVGAVIGLIAGFLLAELFS